jgi:uncharacterized protein YndB with AHSA1/START domain
MVMTMTETAAPYGVYPEPATVRLERRLPGPIERVWRYLTESDLRAQWLASGPMELRVGGVVDLTWRNDELSPGEKRAEGAGHHHRQVTEVTAIDPPRLLSFSWQGGSEVTFELEAIGAEVKLTVTHQRASSRSGLVGVSTGWHAHLDVLAARLAGETPAPFWSNFERLKAVYEERAPRAID